MRLKLVILLFIVCATVFVAEISAQPSLPKEIIPRTIPSDVRSRIEKLYSANPLDRSKAASELGGMGDHATGAIPFLISMLTDKEIYLGKSPTDYMSPSDEATKALAKIGAPCINQLLETMHDSDPDLSRRAARALMKIRDTRAVRPLIDALRNEGSGEVKSQIAWVLGNMKNQAAVTPLIESLQDSDTQVKRNAAWALGEMRDPRAVWPLVDIATDHNWSVRWNAIQALAKIRDVGSVEPLIALTGNPSADVRMNAIWALGELGDRRAVKPLIKVLRTEKDVNVRATAASALASMTGENFDQDADAWEKWRNEEGKIAAGS